MRILFENTEEEHHSHVKINKCILCTKYVYLNN